MSLEPIKQQDISASKVGGGGQRKLVEYSSHRQGGGKLNIYLIKKFEVQVSNLLLEHKATQDEKCFKLKHKNYI